jgi:hypothetical protein
LDSIHRGLHFPGVFSVRLSLLTQIPDFPFAYWIPSPWFRPFRTMIRVADEGLLVKQGMASSDNFRFVRLWWEVPPSKSKWLPYSRGGSFGPQWHDIDVVVNWENNGEEIKAYSASLYGTWTKQITNTQLFGRRGISYPASRVEFSPRVLPEGCVMGNSGPIICFKEKPADEESRLFALLAILSCSSFRALLNLTTTSGDTMSKAYREQAVASMPIPHIEEVDADTIQMVQALVETVRTLEGCQETCRYFVSWREKATIQQLVTRMRSQRKELDEKVSRLFGFSGPDYIRSQNEFDDGVEHLERRDSDLVSLA